MRREYTIIDEAGLHARPASLLVQVATKFPNEINIEYKGRKMTLKSIMIVMSLGVSQNTTIAIEVDGDNAEEVFTALEEVLNSNNLI
jgi:phosphocarrier protein HPr